MVGHTVAKAEPARIVRAADGFTQDALLPAFIDGARRLRAQGADAVTTSCGFLVLAQRALQQALDVPVVTSSLLLLPELLRQEERVGVLTIAAHALGDAHLLAAGVEPARLRDVVVEGVAPDSHFSTAILGNEPLLDAARAGQDVLAAATVLRERGPDLQVIVLECTNMPPYAARIGQATGCRVLSLRDHPVLRAMRDRIGGSPPPGP